MNSARRYILNVSNVISCGVGTSYTNPVQCNVLNGFCVGDGGSVCVYPEITTEELRSLSVLDYEKRIIDYIDTLKIDSDITKERLINEAFFFEGDCETCGLNPNFLVYKFLSGVRVINIGNVSGIAQYKLYPNTANPDDYSWQTNPTFLNLNQNEVYNVIVRDVVQNIEVCRVDTIISMSLLMPSTTLIPQDKIIRLNQISVGNTSNVAYETGCIEIVPPLQPRETLRLDYIANAYVAGGGASCVQFTCKPEGSSTFVDYRCMTDDNTLYPSTGSIFMSYGDTICYNVTAYGETYGSRSEANYCIASIDGLGTINPTIDSTNYIVEIQKNISPVCTVVGFSNGIGNATTTRCTYNGVIDFSEQIPEGQCLVLELSAVTSVLNNGLSTISFSRRNDSASPYITYCTVSSNDPQPMLPELIAYGNDEFCYDITLDVPLVGDGAYACMCVNNMIGSLGVVPILDEDPTKTLVSVHYQRTATPLQVSVCRVNSTSTSANGYINLEPLLTSTNQYVSSILNINQIAADGGSASIEFYCRPSNSSSFNLISDYCAFESTVNESLNIVHRSGDVICYRHSINGNSSSIIDSTFELSYVSSSSDISPTINVNKCRDNLGF